MQRDWSLLLYFWLLCSNVTVLLQAHGRDCFSQGYCLHTPKHGQCTVLARLSVVSYYVRLHRRGVLALLEGVVGGATWSSLRTQPRWSRFNHKVDYDEKGQGPWTETSTEMELSCAVKRYINMLYSLDQNIHNTLSASSPSQLYLSI
ncbi:hypothetical protein BDW74DRAFT_30239 [Aspergillus multicolor]|uniref:uncharacterized protein n=1 Tax=Aspergillus multicolor TaxID=41759 RepID=UPI003CCD058B